MKLLRNCRNIKITWKTIDLTALIRTPFIHIHVVTHQKVVILKSFRHIIEAKYFRFFSNLVTLSFQIVNWKTISIFSQLLLIISTEISYCNYKDPCQDWNSSLDIQICILVMNTHWFIPHKCLIIFQNISCIGSKTLYLIWQFLHWTYLTCICGGDHYIRGSCRTGHYWTSLHDRMKRLGLPDQFIAILRGHSTWKMITLVWILFQLFSICLKSND